jgi:hypothetical protein
MFVCACALFDDAENFALAHDEEFLTVKLDGTASVLTEQNLIASLQVDRSNIAGLGLLARTYGYYLTLRGLLGSRIRDHDAASGLRFLFRAANYHTILQWTDHSSLHWQAKYQPVLIEPR